MSQCNPQDKWGPTMAMVPLRPDPQCQHPCLSPTPTTSSLTPTTPATHSTLTTTTTRSTLLHTPNRWPAAAVLVIPILQTSLRPRVLALPMTVAVAVAVSDPPPSRVPRPRGRQKGGRDAMASTRKTGRASARITMFVHPSWSLDD